MVAVWWIGLHGLLLAVAASTPGPTVVRLGAILLVLVHAAARYPPAPPRVVRDGEGRWAVPALGLAGLPLGPRTRYTTLWVRLSLVAPTRTLDIVLVVDQLDTRTWRMLQVSLRRASGAAATARGTGSARGPADLS